MVKDNKCFSDQEVATLLRQAKRRASRGTIIDKTDFALLTFAYATGCRVSEIASTSLDRTEPNHINMKSGLLTITVAKYGSVGTVPIDAASLRTLRWYAREVRPQLRNAMSLHHLFLSKVGRPYSPNVLTQKLSLLLTRFGFEDKTGHAFRHYFVTDLLRKGCQPHVVQALARHRSPTTTLGIYAHAQPADLRSAVNRRLG